MTTGAAADAASIAPADRNWALAAVLAALTTMARDGATTNVALPNKAASLRVAPDAAV